MNTCIVDMISQTLKMLVWVTLDSLAYPYWVTTINVIQLTLVYVGLRFSMTTVHVTPMISAKTQSGLIVIIHIMYNNESLTVTSLPDLYRFCQLSVCKDLSLVHVRQPSGQLRPVQQLISATSHRLLFLPYITQITMSLTGRVIHAFICICYYCVWQQHTVNMNTGAEFQTHTDSKSVVHVVI